MVHASPFTSKYKNRFPSDYILNSHRFIQQCAQIFIAFTFINDLMSSKALASTESSLPWKNLEMVLQKKYIGHKK